MKSALRLSQSQVIKTHVQIGHVEPEAKDTNQETDPEREASGSDDFPIHV